MINNRVILPSFMLGSHIEPYSGYVTFFSVCTMLVCPSILILARANYVV